MKPIELKGEKKASIQVFKTFTYGRGVLEVSKTFDVGSEFEYTNTVTVTFDNDEAQELIKMLTEIVNDGPNT